MNLYGRCEIKKEWTDWEYSVHELKPQIERQSRAMNYPFTFNIDEKSKTAEFSSTSDLPFYTTSLSECNCHDFQERNLPCKHIYRLAHELGVIEIIKRKPGGLNAELLEEVRNCENIDEHPEQIKRQVSSKKVKVISIDFDNQSGLFAGSGKKPYETTIDTCTCVDYFTRRLPCKHIYKLRSELKKHFY